MPTAVRVALTLAMLLVPIAAAAQASAADPFIGTWEINPGRSNYAVGSPPARFTRTYEDRGGGTVLMIIDRFAADGTPIRSMLVYKRDGKPYPEAAVGARTIRMSTVRSPDPYTEDVTFSNTATPQAGTSVTISKDGRTMTQQLRVTGPDGKPAVNIVVYDRVR